MTTAAPDATPGGDPPDATLDAADHSDTRGPGTRGLDHRRLDHRRPDHRRPGTRRHHDRSGVP
ncbi:hypothetical protein ND748_25675 [Frankia sp. AiPs1]|uniref:hypothetical protein n=1 Tax=Frankia sp. AiPs1 TaxID=573493 RepID=UPI002044103B|nr:hypothetical protein [Frankia sp. AiPs1]MCM3925042.1 hypothetical protein [Frankia sp. AiPs1]